MPTRLNPYLSFSGNAREAMEFYQRVFGGMLALNTFGEFGTEGEQADQVMHAMLETDSGFTLMGSDVPPEMDYIPGNTITVSLSGDDGDELRGYWTALSDGGIVSVPLERQMWGDEFGACVDRFGISWMVNISPPRG
ncbi:VOC family protein [Plantactinospora sp. KLBMP9567]|uniref:VOC family protein n=1 Tax=Plantactinospora sp. KLBMP9567 TaxID=3085900 RepID=UPI00298188C9|nr:VOC family protein [Plantactinospora sp. KLBMP9567]MDW5330508.1 VOC family protein [Plantactinospora sp. KLBMP9567]